MGHNERFDCYLPTDYGGGPRQLEHLQVLHRYLGDLLSTLTEADVALLREDFYDLHPSMSPRTQLPKEWFAKKDKPVPTRVDKPGQIYLIKDENNNTKIGVSRDPKTRLSQLQQTNPSKLSLVHIMQVFDMKTVESRLHNQYQSKRGQGEWFKLTTDDIFWITSITSITNENYAHYFPPYNHARR